MGYDMKDEWICRSFLLLAGIGIGAFLSANILEAASPAALDREPSEVTFTVSVSEVTETLLLGEQFSGRFERDFEMSDGSIRTVTLTPMVRNGHLSVKFDDTGFVTYMGPNGWTINRDLRVDLRNYDQVGPESRD